MNTHISRRTLAKGAAWSAPVIAATAVVPAYASSQCSAKDAGLNNGVDFYYGNTYDSDHQTTDQYFNIHNADAYIIGLHADETIVSATYNLLVQYRGDNPGNPSDDSTVFYSPTGANNASIASSELRTGWELGGVDGAPFSLGIDQIDGTFNPTR